MTKVKKADDATENTQSQVDEWKSKYLRALADYQNLERRKQQEREDIHKFANEVLLVQFFSAIDTLRQAKDHLKDTGLDLSYKQFLTILAEQGVEEMVTVGQPFDPHTMECVEVVDGTEGMVVDQLQPGYTLNGKVLRVAKVKVGKQKEVSYE